MKTTPLRRAAWTAACLLLAACSGVPLTSIPRLLSLPNQLVDAEPAEFLFAVQTDARLVPAADAVPILTLGIHPKQPGDFEPIDDHLPMRYSLDAAAVPGLAPAQPGRRWLIYSLTAASQDELRRVQAVFRQRRAQKDAPRGGTLELGITQDGIAIDNSAYVNTRWESWLQTTRRDGFFKLWSGTAADLMKKSAPGR